MKVKVSNLKVGVVLLGGLGIAASRLGMLNTPARVAAVIAALVAATVVVVAINYMAERRSESGEVTYVVDDNDDGGVVVRKRAPDVKVVGPVVDATDAALTPPLSDEEVREVRDALNDYLTDDSDDSETGGMRCIEGELVHVGSGFRAGDDDD